MDFLVNLLLENELPLYFIFLWHPYLTIDINILQVKIKRNGIRSIENCLQLAFERTKGNRFFLKRMGMKRERDRGKRKAYKFTLHI